MPDLNYLWQRRIVCCIYICCRHYCKSNAVMNYFETCCKLCGSKFSRAQLPYVIAYWYWYFIKIQATNVQESMTVDNTMTHCIPRKINKRYKLKMDQLTKDRLKTSRLHWGNYWWQWSLITSPQGRALWCTYLYVCLLTSISQNQHDQTSCNFLCLLPIATVLSTSDDNAIHYLLLVLSWHNGHP